MYKALPEADLHYILENTSSLWDEFRDQQIFITGGTGFFGLWLLSSFAYVNAALNLNAKAVILSRDPEKFLLNAPHLVNNSALSFHQGDVRDFTFPPGHFSHVIHAATETTAVLYEKTPLHMLDVILQGTQHTLNFAKQAQAQKVLLTSSGAVYGRQPSNITHISEDYTGSPDITSYKSAYGIGKRTAEHMAALFQYQAQLQVKIARCFAFVGPGLPLDAHFAIGNFIRDAMAQKTIELNSDGTPFRSYQYASDLTIWLWHILVRGESNRAYNVGSDEDMPLRELARVVTETLGSTQGISIKKTAPENHKPERFVPSIARCQQELNLSNQIKLPEAIRKTAAWHASF